MLKKFGAMLLVLALLASVLPAAFAEEGEEEEGETMSYAGDAVGYDPDTDTVIVYKTEYSTSDLPYPTSVEFDPPKTMYVYTENGGTLNVRSSPEATDNKYGTLNYGAQVKVAAIASDTDWYIIEYQKSPTGYAFVMARFIVSTKPTARPTRKPTASPAPGTVTIAPVTAAPTAQPTPDSQARKEAELGKQLASYKAWATPMIGTVRATRTSGWINFRQGPGVASAVLTTLNDGTQMRILGETDGWYYGVETVSGYTGYIAKSYIMDMYPAPAQSQQETTEKTQLGKLTVNGEFALQCALPAGYQIQVINTLGTRIIAAITSVNPEMPVMDMTIAFDETYSSVDRMNDMGQDALDTLEASFTQMNIVDITYRETAYGTKLMVVREIGPEPDFVDILTVYKGYSIEFLMRPNPAASSQELTEAQIQMCVDFLSELDFVEVK